MSVVHLGKVLEEFQHNEITHAKKLYAKEKKHTHKGKGLTMHTEVNTVGFTRWSLGCSWRADGSKVSDDDEKQLPVSSTEHSLDK